MTTDDFWSCKVACNLCLHPYVQSVVVSLWNNIEIIRKHIPQSPRKKTNDFWNPVQGCNLYANTGQLDQLLFCVTKKKISKFNDGVVLLLPLMLLSTDSSVSRAWLCPKHWVLSILYFCHTITTMLILKWVKTSVYVHIIDQLLFHHKINNNMVTE